ncbi:MAG: hypothetical protein HZA14_00530 [Nitrospirae bacterium]|nr:hypothetical protein [Nitrospirota bacterium]
MLKRSSIILMCAVSAAAFCGTDLQAAIRQVHPPIILPAPRPPQQYLRKAFFYKLESRDVVKAFKDHGLEAEEVSGFTMGATAAKETVMFFTPSYGSDVGGLAASYDSKDQLEDAARYYSAMNVNPASPAWRIYRRYNILLLISGRVPEEKAREYERVLHEMDKK